MKGDSDPEREWEGKEQDEYKWEEHSRQKPSGHRALSVSEYPPNARMNVRR